MTGFVPGGVSIGLICPGEVKQTFFARFVELVLHDLSNQHRLFSHDRFWIQGHYGSGGIVQGRNDVALAMCETSQAEWLMWIDADMGFDPDIIDRLVDSADPVERPVVGALCFAQKNAGQKPFGARSFLTIPTIYEFVVRDGEAGVVPNLDYPRDSLVKCAATGAAAILIHRSVLETMRSRFDHDWYTPIRHGSGTVFSEDLSFCYRLGALDIPLHVNTAVKTTHDKGGIFLDEELFDHERAHREGDC